MLGRLLAGMGTTFAGLPAYLVTQLDASECDRGLVFCQPPLTLAATLRSHQDRLIGFAHLDLNAPGAHEEVARLKELGYRGIGEISPATDYVAPDDFDRHGQTYETLIELQMPIVWHLGDSFINNPSLGEFGSLERLQRVAAAYPSLRQVMAHCGRQLDAWRFTAAFLGYPNVFLDLSVLAAFVSRDLPPMAGQGSAARLTRSLQEATPESLGLTWTDALTTIRQVISALPTRSLFASDAPFAGTISLAKALCMEATAHDLALQRDVMGGNFDRLMQG